MRRGFSLIEVMIVIAVIAIIAAIAIPNLLSAQRSSNEKSGMMSLKSVGTAQADFRSNDRDGNRFADYWTGDVSGLYRLLSPGGSPIQLVEYSVALMDGAPLAAGAANGLMGPALNPESTKAGYWVMALNQDLNPAPPANYKQDTDPQMGPVHHTQKFGFIAYPDAYGASGRIVFIMNEEYSVFRRDPGQEVASPVPNPKPIIAGWDDYPLNPLANGWGKID